MKAFVDANLLICLNTMADVDYKARYEDLYIEAIADYKPYTTILVLDELLHISWKKYNIHCYITMDFIEEIVKPYIDIIPPGEEEYELALELVRKHNIKFSDFLHLGAMKRNSINVIISEDKELGKID